MRFVIRRLGWRAVIVTALSAQFLLLVAAGFVVEAAHRHEEEAIASVTQAYGELIVLRELQGAILQAESARRGYFLFKDERFLAVSTAAEARIGTHLREMASLVHGADQIARLAALQRDIDRRMAYLQRGTVLLASGSDVGRLRDTVTPGLRLSADLTRTIDSMSRDERRLLAVRRQAAAVSQRNASLAGIALALPALGIMLLSAWLYRYEANRRSAAEAVLSEAAREAQWQRVVAEEAQAAAETATRAKSEFLATMSHELRTPMTGVLGMVELLQHDVSGVERGRYFAALKESARNLMNVLNDILDFSKFEAGKFEVETVDFELEKVVAPTIELFSGAASKKGLLLTHKLETGDATCIVQGDPTRLRQVLSNLISNAIKFTETGGVAVVVRAMRLVGNPNLWRFEVSDTGIGIAPEVQRTLFSAFTQAEASTTRRFGGTGLGLAISRHLVEAMGGEIGIESVPGQGSTFWFEVPLAPAADQSQRTAPTELTELKPASQPLRILVAEDNHINQLLLTGLLGRLGHDVTCVGDGRQAVQRAGQETFDVILMDMQMPEMDGRAATMAIRALAGSAGQTPIFALTADAARETRASYDNIGLTGFLTKPIDINKLVAALGALPVAEAAVTVPPAPGSTFDPARLDELRQMLGAETLAALLGAFARDAGAVMAMLRQAHAADDVPAARVAAHTLKGVAANVGAVKLATAAAALEAALNGEGWPEDLLSALERQLSQAEAEAVV